MELTMDTTEKLGNILLLLMILLFFLVPVTEWNSAGVVQKQLNEQCGTNYSQRDLYFSSEKLIELCKIKNQELLIKQ
jgi:hypothetical protein